MTDYAVMCDSQLHFCLRVEVGKSNTKFIPLSKKRIDLATVSNDVFEKLYTSVYAGYSLEKFAQMVFGRQQYGVIVTHRAKAHLNHFSKELPMSKLGTEVTAPKSEPAKDIKVPETPVVPAGPPIPELKKVKEPKAPKEPKEPKAPKEPILDADGNPIKARNKREKFVPEKKIKVLAPNPARVGTIRFNIVETICLAKNVQEALDSTVTRKDGTEYKIGVPDLYFALDNGIISLD